LPDLLNSGHERRLGEMLTQFDVKVSGSGVCNHCHLNSVGAKVRKAICKSRDEILFSIKVIAIYTARLIHDYSEFNFTT